MTTSAPGPSNAPTSRATHAEINALFVERWSSRSFSGERPTPDQVRSLFEAARWAPSASNVQPWIFVYADDEETLARTRPLLRDGTVWPPTRWGGVHRDRVHGVLGVAAEEYDFLCMVAIGKRGAPELLPEDLRGREVPSSRKPIAEFAIRVVAPSKASCIVDTISPESTGTSEGAIR